MNSNYGPFETTENVDSLYPSRFLKAADLEGGAIRVAIAGISRETVNNKGKDEIKNALHFVGSFLPMILNKTNKETLKRLFGVNPRLWIGKVIEVYATETPVGTEMVPCLRIRPVAAPRVAASAAADDWKTVGPSTDEHPFGQ